jgi:hypothetical protein
MSLYVDARMAFGLAHTVGSRGGGHCSPVGLIYLGEVDAADVAIAKARDEELLPRKLINTGRDCRHVEKHGAARQGVLSQPRVTMTVSIRAIPFTMGADSLREESQK